MWCCWMREEKAVSWVGCGELFEGAVAPSRSTCWGGSRLSAWHCTGSQKGAPIVLSSPSLAEEISTNQNRATKCSFSDHF